MTRMLMLVMVVTLFLSQMTFSAKNEPEDPVHYWTRESCGPVMACGYPRDPWVKHTARPNEVTCLGCKRVCRKGFH
jgi:hypothetical protein